MEFKIGRDKLLVSVQKTLGIVEKKTTMPILNNILIRVQGDKIRVAATDREIGIVTDSLAEVVSEGDITLSAKKLYEMVKEIQGETVHLKKNEQNIVTVVSQQVVYKIPGLPANEFPDVFDGEEGPLFKIQGSVLQELIRKTFFAVSTDELRRNLNGGFLEVGKEGPSHLIKMVATDGHRLAMAHVEMEGEFLELEKGIIIPRKGLHEIRRLAEDENGDVFMGIQKGMCILKTSDTTLKVSLLDGEYPDYRKVIPKEDGNIIQFNKDDFLHALKRMNVISSARYSGVVVTLSENKVILNSTNPDVGEASEEIAVTYHGKSLAVGYNVNYLIDAIEVITEDDVIFEISEGMKPGLIRPKNNDRFKCIVMPLKI
jgi:DNA polymerase-3 subunit beta